MVSWSTKGLKVLRPLTSVKKNPLLTLGKFRFSAPPNHKQHTVFQKPPKERNETKVTAKRKSNTPRKLSADGQIPHKMIRSVTCNNLYSREKLTQKIYRTSLVCWASIL